MIRHLINFLQRPDTSLLNRNIDFDTNDSKQYSVVGMTIQQKLTIQNMKHCSTFSILLAVLTKNPLREKCPDTFEAVIKRQF